MYATFYRDDYLSRPRFIFEFGRFVVCTTDADGFIYIYFARGKGGRAELSRASI